MEIHFNNPASLILFANKIKMILIECLINQEEGVDVIEYFSQNVQKFSKNGLEKCSISELFYHD